MNWGYIIVISIISYFLMLLITIKVISFWVKETFKEELNAVTQLRKINLQLYKAHLYQLLKDGHINIEEMEKKIKDFEV